MNKKELKLKWDELFFELKSKNVIIHEQEKNKLIWYLNEFGYEIIITNYKNIFLFQFNNNYFKKGTNLQSFIELFNFDRAVSKLLLSDILNIEKRFSNAILLSINKYIQNRITNSNENFWTLKLRIKDFQNEENKNIFLKLFSNQDSFFNRKMNNFFVFLKNNENINKNFSIRDLLLEFNKDRNYDLKIIEQIEKELKKYFLKKKIKKREQTTELLKLINNQELFSSYCKNYKFKKILESMSNNFLDKKIKEKTIAEISKKWSLGTWIQIFECLNKKTKKEVIDNMFYLENIKWNYSERTSTFIEIMRLFQKIRNKCCHNEVIFDFKRLNDQENKKILNFLSINSNESENKINSVNLWAAVNCIEIFDSNNKTSRTDIKKLIMKNYEKINIDLLPSDVKNFLKKQVGQ